jgi:hypothetical protein
VDAHAVGRARGRALVLAVGVAVVAVFSGIDHAVVAGREHHRAVVDAVGRGVRWELGVVVAVVADLTHVDDPVATVAEVRTGIAVAITWIAIAITIAVTIPRVPVAVAGRLAAVSGSAPVVVTAGARQRQGHQGQQGQARRSASHERQDRFSAKYATVTAITIGRGPNPSRAARFAA